MSAYYKNAMARRLLARHRADPNVAEVAQSIADPVRCAMLFALLGGSELAAAELAARGGASPQAASGHLAKLVERGLLVVRARGRQRLFRLASSDVGRAMEALAVIARPPAIVALEQNATIRRLREARSCYDHLAGRLGVAVTEAFVECGAIRNSGDGFRLSRDGETLFLAQHIDVDSARRSRRSFARACMDWTERRPHLAGSLGAAVRDRFLAAGWIVENPRDRALHVTPEGRSELRRRFRIRLED